jgi:hypothetical protein
MTTTVMIMMMMIDDVPPVVRYAPLCTGRAVTSISAGRRPAVR